LRRRKRVNDTEGFTIQFDVPAIPCNVGDSLKGFGRFDWVVLDLSDNMREALIMTEDVIRDEKPYNHRKMAIIWKFCSLRTYLNRQFIQSFHKKEQDCIAEKEMENYRNSRYGTIGGWKTKDKVFLLSFEEAERYFPYNQDRVAKHKKVSSNEPKIPCTWWLRSPGKKYRQAAVVDENGEIKHCTDVNASLGVRPALWVKLDALTKCNCELVHKEEPL